MKPSALLSVLFICSASALNFFRQGTGDRNFLGSSFDGPSVPGNNPLKHCGSTERDLVEIKRVDLVPNPPLPGETLRIVAEGFVHDVIYPGAKVYVTIKYGLITLLKERVDICDHSGEVDLECPIQKGPLLLTKEVKIPSQIPPGKYNVLANATTVDDRLLTCLTALVEFPRTF